jgi:hypothetical protein
MPGLARGKPSWMKELPAITISIYGNGSGVLFAPDTGASAMENLSKGEWINLTARAIDWILKAVGLEAELLIYKDAFPKVLTAKFASQGKKEKHAMVKIKITNIGLSDLYNLSIREELPDGFVAKGQLEWEVDELPAGNSTELKYSVWVPSGEAGDYELITYVSAVDGKGNNHSFNESFTLRITLPPGFICEDKDKGKDKGKGKGEGKKCKIAWKGGGKRKKPDVPPGLAKKGGVPPGQNESRLLPGQNQSEVQGEGNNSGNNQSGGQGQGSGQGGGSGNQGGGSGNQGGGNQGGGNQGGGSGNQGGQGQGSGQGGSGNGQSGGSGKGKGNGGNSGSNSGNGQSGQSDKPGKGGGAKKNKTKK